jgi:hypothetical protein
MASFQSCEEDDMEAEFDGKYVTVQESGGMAILTAAEARALRDFLNKVFQA